jgi:hypothetical protein
MKELRPGHLYELDMFEDTPDDLGNQRIQFIEKVPINNGVELKTINNGTTNEEVLSMLISRMNYLQSKFPCEENADAIYFLSMALKRLNDRTKNRIARNVEGKQIA